MQNDLKNQGTIHQIHQPHVLCKATYSAAKQVRMFTQAEDGHLQHLLHGTVHKSSFNKAYMTVQITLNFQQA
jgi:hypothetical protein